MFSKAKRFELQSAAKTASKVPKQQDTEKLKPLTSATATQPKLKIIVPTPTKKSKNNDAQSQTSSVTSVKSFATPKPLKSIINKAPGSVKKTIPSLKCPTKPQTKVSDELIKAQEVEIRNKDYTISEYNKQIEDLKNEIATLQKQLTEVLKTDKECNYVTLDKKLAQMTLDNQNIDPDSKLIQDIIGKENNNLKLKIFELEQVCERLEHEISNKQVELSSLEEVITIRDSLCQDLQEKLTNVETCLEETRQRLEMVKGHHALALEANESIRREYKAELETLKTKLEEEKQTIITKSKAEQDNIKAKYNTNIQSIKNDLMKERDEMISELQQQLSKKDLEIKAKLEQIDEATHEKLRLCEIQFEERSQNLQEHWSQQQETLEHLEKETKELRYNLSLVEEQNLMLQQEMNNLKNENHTLKHEKNELIKKADEIKEESKRKCIGYENEINKLTVEVEKVGKEKNKFEMSLSVTRDIVEVITLRLRESDNELEHLEGKVQMLTKTKEALENELMTCKNTLNNTALECNEYKDALVNILKSKAALAKEHTRIMEHNVSLIESLQNVEKEAYRELGSIKNELIEDVELLKKESNTQIQMLRKEVEKKRVLCELAKDHAGQATVAAEQSRALLAQSTAEISRLEAENQSLQNQIQDQQSLVVELSLLRQENEELTMTVAKQSSIIEKMKKDMEQIQPKPKSPSVIRKSHKLGKENFSAVISPLRERNH